MFSDFFIHPLVLLFILHKFVSDCVLLQAFPPFWACCCLFMSLLILLPFLICVSLWFLVILFPFISACCLLFCWGVLLFCICLLVLLCFPNFVYDCSSLQVYPFACVVVLFLIHCSFFFVLCVLSQFFVILLPFPHAVVFF